MLYTVDPNFPHLTSNRPSSPRHIPLSISPNPLLVPARAPCTSSTNSIVDQPALAQPDHLKRSVCPAWRARDWKSQGRVAWLGRPVWRRRALGSGDYNPQSYITFIASTTTVNYEQTTASCQDMGIRQSDAVQDRGQRVQGLHTRIHIL